MFFQQIINGLSVGSVYALVTVGFSMVWSILLLVNFAHSSFYILGAYVTLFMMAMFGMNFKGYLLAIAVSILVSTVLTFVMERGLLRTIRNRKAAGISAMLCTIGVQAIINNGIQTIFGSESKAFPDVLKLGKFKFNLLGSEVVVTWFQIVILIVALLLMLIASGIVYKTKVGTAMRAISQNPLAAQLVGVNVNAVITMTFIMGSVIAVIAGSMVGMHYRTIDTAMAVSVSSKTMAAAILGGIGYLPGAVVGSLIIGVSETLFSAYISSGYKDAIAFCILIIFILFKPTGLFGKKNVVKV